MVSIAAFQAVDPGSIPGQRKKLLNVDMCECICPRPCGTSNGKKKSQMTGLMQIGKVLSFCKQCICAFLYVLYEHVPLQIGAHDTIRHALVV